MTIRALTEDPEVLHSAAVDSGGIRRQAMPDQPGMGHGLTAAPEVNVE